MSEDSLYFNRAPAPYAYGDGPSVRQRFDGRQRTRRKHGLSDDPEVGD